MQKLTRLIRRIPEEELEQVISERDQALGLLKNHGPQGTTALDQGQTIWLRNLLPAGELIENNLDQQPATQSFIEQITPRALLGKAYWHRLRPGQGIRKHSDLAVQQEWQGRILHRYHVYTSIDPGIEVDLDGGIRQDPRDLAWTLQDFALELEHAYTNQGAEDFWLLVWDQLKPDNPQSELRQTVDPHWPDQKE